MKELVLIAPEVFLSVVALLLLVGEAFFPRERKLWAFVGIGSLALCLAHQVMFFCEKAVPGAAAFGVQPIAVSASWVQYDLVYGMISVDSLAGFFKIAIMAAVLMVLWLSLDYYEFIDISFGTYTSLLLFSTVGMMFLVGSTDFLSAIISLELLSIGSFILTGFILGRKSSSEAAIKFLLVGTLSTAIFLFGASYYYGYFGSTSLLPVQHFGLGGQAPDMALSLIMMFLVAGLGFKLAMVPFHMWAPDAYEGAPTPITAFLSVAPKAAAVAFLLRLLSNHAALGLTSVLGVLAAITMTVGNVGALQQSNVKRLLAYSSIAQVGYILVAIVAGGTLGSQAAMIYTFVYVFMNLGVFAALMTISVKTHSEEVVDFAGLSSKSMGLSLVVIVFLLSLTGLPPMAGFVGKFAIFASVINTPSLTWLGVIAVLNSVISLYYYFRLAQQMFFKEASSNAAPTFTPALLSCLVIALVITLSVGLFPDRILGWVRNVVGS
jgi:NADH-quinone oxidoreductase subunit N